MDLSLSQKTLIYWNVSASYNGVEGVTSVTTETALTTFNNLLQVLGPQHPLVRRIQTLQNAVIYGTPKKPKRKKTDPPPPVATVLLLHATM